MFLLAFKLITVVMIFEELMSLHTCSKGMQYMHTLALSPGLIFHVCTQKLGSGDKANTYKCARNNYVATVG